MCRLCWNGWGSSMVTQIVFDPLISIALLVLLGGVMALGVGLGLWRGLSGWWLRGLVAMVVLTALANPSLQQENRQPLSDIVLVVTDRSASQSIDPRTGQIDQATAALEAALDALPDLDVRTVSVQNAADGRDEGTLVMQALTELAAEAERSRIAGAIVVTDGQIHDMAAAPDFPAPVHALITGHENEWDRRIVLLGAPSFAILGEPVMLTLKIEDQGRVPADLPTTTDLSISIDGGTPQEFRVQVGVALELPLTLPHGGANVLQFVVPTAEGELTDRNNAAVVSINGVRDRLRVLLVSGEPHPGERTWRNLLKSDSAVDLVHFTILRPPGKQDGVPVNEMSLIAFPTRELFLDKIDDFDLIIFDRYRRRGILPSIYLESVSRYVEDGGAVLVATGPAFAGVESLYRSPLARVLPAQPTARVFEVGFTPRVSDLGARHPVTEGLENFAPRPTAEDGTPGWGRWFRMLDMDARSGNVVMTGPDARPLLILDRVGQGRIAMLASDQAWLWHRGFEGGGPQLELLRRLAHWMMKEPELEEEDLSAGARGQNVTVTRRSLDPLARDVTVTGPDGVTQILEMTETRPGRFEAQFTGNENGLYRLSDGVLDGVVALGPTAPKEFEQTVSTGTILAPLVNATGGGVFRLENGNPKIRRVRQGRAAFGRNWLGLETRNAYVTKEIRLYPIGSPLIFLLAASLLLLIAWRREGR